MSIKWIVCSKAESKKCKEINFSYELYRDWCHSLVGKTPEGIPLRCKPISRKAYNKL